MRRKLTVPTLLLWGEKDGALGQQACTTQPRFCRCRCRWGPHHDDWVLAVCAAFISHATQAAWHHSFHATPMPCPLLPCLIPVQLLRGTERYVETLTIQVLPGCSHWVQQDQPEEVNRRMREFLPPPQQAVGPAGRRPGAPDSPRCPCLPLCQRRLLRPVAARRGPPTWRCRVSDVQCNNIKSL